MEYDAVILGAGIAGLSTARELAKLKKRVLILEENKTAGRTSRAAAGILDPYTEAEKETPLLRLGMKALDAYPAFLDEITHNSPKEVEYEKTGMLYLSFTPEDESLLGDRVQWQKGHGIPVVKLSREEVLKEEPHVSPAVKGGAFYPKIAKLNADKLVTFLFDFVRVQGIEMRTEVNAWLWKEGEKVRGVQLGTERIEAKAVVFAKGCWAGQDPDLGIKLEISPVRGQILIVKTQPPFEPRHMLHTLRYGYLIPWPDGRILIGSTLESAGFDNRVTPEGKEAILSRVGEIYEKVRELPIEKSWAGLRPYAKRERPFIGPTPVKGLFLACGYYRSGILIGPYVGKLLAEGIVSGKFSPLLEPFFY